LGRLIIVSDKIGQLLTMQPKLPKAPLVEAVCEIRMDPSVPWDLTIPGRLFDKLQPMFSERKQTAGVEFTVKALETPETGYRQIEQLHFLSKDGKDVVQVREHSVAISRLAPYMGWENFKPVVMDVLSKLVAIASNSAIARMGLKYINRIAIPKAQLRLEDYFDIYPFLGAKLPQTHGPFLVGVVFPFDDQLNYLKAELTSADTDVPDSYHALFNLDYFTQGGEHLKFESLPEWLEVAHSRIEEAFYAAIKEPTLRLFEEH
jgi:uncharacterized protein (TIGR04255 family)